MIQFNKLFVVYDPTRQEQPALERAADIARENSASLYVFACIYADTEKFAQPSAEVARLIEEQREILAKIVEPLSAEGLKVSIDVEWDKDWYHAVVRASAKLAADMVLKSSFKHSAGKRLLNRTSDWTIMRECLCPVFLVKDRAPRDVPRVLAAIDINAKKESYERLNHKVIEVAGQILNLHRAEVHIVNAFSDFKGIPDRAELVRSSGIASDRIHIKMGDPEKVIVAQAKALDASLVVVGNSARSGVSAVLHGNTVEKMLDKLECNVLSLP
ncbi:MAG: universal stress protein E [Halioglobus sp.]|jgi:universal stress protein E